MNIGFTGHRDTIANEEDLLRIEETYPDATWIHGGAEGFDSQVHQVALRLGKVQGETLIILRPNYHYFPGKIAPLMRNETIVSLSSLIVACYDGRKIGGTFYTINYAHKRGIPVNVLTPSGTIPHPP